MGVSNIVAFDAHDPRVCNAVPLMGFDNIIPTYQVLKALFKYVNDFKMDKDHFVDPALYEKWYSAMAGNPHNVYVAEILNAWER